MASVRRYRIDPVQAVQGDCPGVEADSFVMNQTESDSMVQMECYPKMRQRGVVTIPQEVRDGLNLDEGGQLELTVENLN